MFPTAVEIGGRGAGAEKTIGVVRGGKVDDASVQTGASQTLGEGMGSALTGVILILVEDDIDLAAGLIAQLGPLKRRQVRAHGASGVAEAGLPQRGQIEQAFHQDHGGA